MKRSLFRVGSNFFRGIIVGFFLLFCLFFMSVRHGFIYLNPNTAFYTTQDSAIDFSDIEKELGAMYAIIQEEYYDQDNIDSEKMLRQSLVAFVSALGDPFSSYLPPRETQEIQDAVKGDDSIEGIGAVLSQRVGGVVIVEITHGSPAERAGLMPLDLIIEVDGESVQLDDIHEVVDKIRGPKGTDVVVSVMRAAKDGEKEVVKKTITRDIIDIPSVSSKILSGDYVLGYLQVASFAGDTTKRLQQASSELLDTGVEGLILDLRGDGGGLLSESVSVSSLFVSKGKTITEARYRSYKNENYRATGGDRLSSLPLVVLIDKYTASASEITALALRENRCESSIELSLQEEGTGSVLSGECSVVLLGSRSFGKGSVQSLINLDFGGSLKLTIGKRFSPSGLSIDQQGILPDYSIEFDAESYYELGFDNQLEEAQTILSTYLQNI